MIYMIYRVRLFSASREPVEFLPTPDDSFAKPIHSSRSFNFWPSAFVLFFARVMLSLANSISASAASRSLSMSSLSTTTSTIITKTKTTGASGEGRN